MHFNAESRNKRLLNQIPNSNLILSIKAVVQDLLLMALTSMRNPQIMSNWKHLLPNHPEVHRLHDKLMDDLQKIVEEVDTMNATAGPNNAARPRVCQTFNPRYLETSVSL